MVEEYREYRRRQPSQRNPEITVKGATVNREMEYLQCMFRFAVTRNYIAESPAAGVRHFDERPERPAKRMLSVEEEQRIFEAAPPYLRVAIYRNYIAESPAAGVRHFDERPERPAKRMLSVEEEQRIFEAAPPYLRVA